MRVHWFLVDPLVFPQWSPITSPDIPPPRGGEGGGGVATSLGYLIGASWGFWGYMDLYVTEMAPTWPRNGSKKAPIWSPGTSKMVLSPKRRASSAKLACHIRFLSMFRLSYPFAALKWLKMAPRWLQNGPKMSPRWAQDGPETVSRLSMIA